MVAGALALSLGIELLQLTFISGRDASLSDLITNTIGAAAAAAVAPYWARLLLPGPRVAARLFAAWSVLWLAILAFSSWLQWPDRLEDTLVGIWEVNSGSEAAFTGNILSVAVNGRTASRSRILPDSAAIRRALERGVGSLEVRAISGSPTPGLAPLYSVKARRGQGLALYQIGRDAVFVVPAQARRLRVWPPTIQLADAFPPEAGLPVVLHATLRDRTLWLGSTWGGRRREAAVALSPTLGWSAVVPWRFTLGRLVGLLTGLWVAGLMLPLGYWAGALRRPEAGLGATALLLAAGLGGLPPLLGFQPVPWSQWLAGALGAALGWALHRLAAYLQGRCASPSTSGSSSS